MCRRVLAHEEGMMVDVVIAPVDVCKERYLDTCGWIVRVLNVHEIGRDEIKRAGVKLDLLLKVKDTEAVVAELVVCQYASSDHAPRYYYLVDCSWACCKTLEGSYARLIFFKVVYELLRELAWFD